MSTTFVVPVLTKNEFPNEWTKQCNVLFRGAAELDEYRPNTWTSLARKVKDAMGRFYFCKLSGTGPYDVASEHSWVLINTVPPAGQLWHIFRLRRSPRVCPESGTIQYSHNDFADGTENGFL